MINIEMKIEMKISYPEKVIDKDAIEKQFVETLTKAVIKSANNLENFINHLDKNISSTHRSNARVRPEERLFSKMAKGTVLGPFSVNDPEGFYRAINDFMEFEKYKGNISQ